MDGENSTIGSQIIVMTRNMVEAADLIETFEQHGIRTVNVFRDVSSGREALNDALLTTKLVVFAFDTQSNVAQDFIELVFSSGVPLLIMDGNNKLARTDTCTVVHRPYDSSDIRSALRRLGLTAT